MQPSSAGSSVKSGKGGKLGKKKSKLGKGLKGGAKLALLYFTVEGVEWAFKKVTATAAPTTPATPSLVETLRSLVEEEGGSNRKKRSITDDGSVVAKTIATIERLRQEVAICRAEKPEGACKAEPELEQWELDGHMSESELCALLALGLTSTAVIVAVTYRFCLKALVPNTN